MGAGVTEIRAVSQTGSGRDDHSDRAHYAEYLLPPHQPTPKRCYALGQALRQAVESWPSDKRVAVIASGGLSHFVIDEELDHQVITAMQNSDAATLTSIPKERLNSENSEIRNWIATAGAAEHLKMQLIDYVPCYRSPAGTGCAMSFARWV